jgi:hypothetical protein
VSTQRASRVTRFRGTQPRPDNCTDSTSSLDANGGIADAVRNARDFDDNCPSGCCSGRDPADEGHLPGRCDPVRRDPSTGVWRLVEGLGITNTCRQKG